MQCSSYQQGRIIILFLFLPERYFSCESLQAKTGTLHPLLISLTVGYVQKRNVLRKTTILHNPALLVPPQAMHSFHSLRLELFSFDQWKSGPSRQNRPQTYFFHSWKASLARFWWMQYTLGKACYGRNKRECSWMEFRPLSDSRASREPGPPCEMHLFVSSWVDKKRTLGWRLFAWQRVVGAPQAFAGAAKEMISRGGFHYRASLQMALRAGPFGEKHLGLHVTSVLSFEVGGWPE